jgi:hypothetical protein
LCLPTISALYLGYATANTADSRQPLLVHGVCSVRDVRLAMRRRASSRERRASARRGCRNTFAQTQAPLFGRPPTVYVRIAVALALYRYHGGLTPPAPVLVYGRLRAKKRFLRCANAHSQERRALARRGSTDRTLRRENRVLFANDATDEHKRHAFIVGRRSPLPVRLS